MLDLAARSANAREDEKGVLRVDPNTPAGDRAGYDQEREWLVPRYAAAQESLAAALRSIRKVGRTALVDGIPLCLAPEGTTTVASAPACYLPTANDAQSPGSDTYAAACERCTERARCPGVPRGYLARFGADELKPFSPAAGVEPPAA
jgi:hypothetical protein